MRGRLDVNGYDKLSAAVGAAVGTNLTISGSGDSADIVIRNWTVPQKVRLSSFRCGSLRIESSTFEDELLIAEAQLMRLTLADCLTSGLVINKSVFDEVDVRGKASQFSIMGSRLTILTVHDVGSVLLQDVTSGAITISAVNRIAARDVRTDQISLSEDFEPTSTQISLRELDVRKRAEITRCGQVAIDCQDSIFAALTVSVCSLTKGHFLNVEIPGELQFRAVDSDENNPILLSGRLRGDVRLDAANRDNRLSVVLGIDEEFSKKHGVDLAECNLSSDLILEGKTSIQLIRGAVDGALRVVPSEDSSQMNKVKLHKEFRIERMQVDFGRIGNAREARLYVKNSLGSASEHTLSTLRRSLGDRPREQDQVYFAERCSQMGTGSAWLLNAVKRWLLGFGVRLAEPANALLLGILMTAFVVFTRSLSTPIWGSNDGGLLRRFGRCLTLAAQLWFNVGVGLPATLQGAGWAAFAVLCAAGGLILITTLIGIGIRRLVR